MALADHAALVRALNNTRDVGAYALPTLTTIAGLWFDTWTQQVPAGVAPTTAVVPTSATAGALQFADASGGQLGIVGAEFRARGPGVYMICDRLSHQGGLVGNVTSAQTTNLPTAALTRYTTGVGVMIGLTIYTQIGASGATVTVSYTNDAGTSGQVSQGVGIGTTNARSVGRMIQIPLLAGDQGVRAVASVTHVVTTGTAGNYGVTLFKPLAAVIVDEQHGVTVANIISGRIGGGMPEVVNGACLFVMTAVPDVVAQVAGRVILAEW